MYDWEQFTAEEQALEWGPGPLSDPGNEVSVHLQPAWLPQESWPEAQKAMETYAKEAMQALSPESFAWTMRIAGYTNEKGEPTELWSQGYETGLVSFPPTTTQPIDASHPFNMVPTKYKTESEKDESDFLPFIPGFAGWDETVTRTQEGKLLSDITGTLKWAAILIGIAGVGYVVLRRL